jgi:hypothetical protein
MIWTTGQIVGIPRTDITFQHEKKWQNKLVHVQNIQSVHIYQRSCVPEEHCIMNNLNRN